jgi:hypothetical protein
MGKTISKANQRLTPELLMIQSASIDRGAASYLAEDSRARNGYCAHNGSDTRRACRGDGSRSNDELSTPRR